MNWYAVYVKPRHEFVTQGELYKKNIETFLPTYKSMRQWKDRKKWINFPLFPGYLFVSVVPHPESFLFVAKTKGVIKVVSSGSGHPVPAANEEIDSLRIVIESGLDFDVHPCLSEGTPIKITKGPLKGAEGVIIKKLEQYMLRVNIEILGRSVGVDVSGDHLEIV